MDIIPVVTALNLMVQRVAIDVAVIQPAVEHAISKLEYLKTNDGHYIQEFITLLGEGKQLYGRNLENMSQQQQVPKTAIDKFIDNLIENLRKRFPSESLSVICAFDCLAMRDLSFIPKSELNEYGTTKFDILLQHYGEVKKDASGGELSPLINQQGTTDEYGLLKTLVLQQRYARDQMPVFWKKSINVIRTCFQIK